MALLLFIPNRCYHEENEALIYLTFICIILRKTEKHTKDLAAASAAISLGVGIVKRFQHSAWLINIFSAILWMMLQLKLNFIKNFPKLINQFYAWTVRVESFSRFFFIFVRKKIPAWTLQWRKIKQMKKGERREKSFQFDIKH